MPCPNCVIHTIPGRPASEHTIGIYLSHECSALRGLHPYFALRSHVPLVSEIERRELCNAVADRQSRCHGEVRASRSARARVLDEAAVIGPIVVSRRSDRRSRRGTGGRGSGRRHHCGRCGRGRGTWWRRRCGRRRRLLWRARSDRENGSRKQNRAHGYRESSRRVVGCESSRHVVILLSFGLGSSPAFISPKLVGTLEISNTDVVLFTAPTP